MITHNWWRSFHGSPVPGPRERPPQAHQSHQFRPACSPWRRKRHPGWVSLNGLRLKHREMVWIWGNILNQKPWFLPMKYGGFLQISFKPIHWIKKWDTHHVDNGWVCPKTRLFSQPFADCSMRLVLSIVINLLNKYILCICIYYMDMDVIWYRPCFLCPIFFAAKQKAQTQWTKGHPTESSAWT